MIFNESLQARAAAAGAAPASTGAQGGAGALDSGTLPATATRPAATRAGTRDRRRLARWLVPALPAVAELVVGGYRIGVPSLWRDEAATISGSQRPFGAILAMLANQDVVHGPYYLLMRVVIAVAGTSATVLRLPSLIAMCLAVAATAALGQRLARATGLAAPAVTGMAAGLLLAAVPLTTRYAQEARPYALTSLFAVLASYLLVLAVRQRRAAPWAGYAAAVALTGMSSLFALLILVAHGVSLAWARAGTGNLAAEPQSADRPVPGSVLRWLAAVAAAFAVLSPMLILGAAQRSQLNWVVRPGIGSVASLAAGFAGVALLVPVSAGLAVLGAAAGPGMRRGRGMTLAVITLPWLVLPPLLLIAVSQFRPVYVERYVIFCLPALSILTAAGLTRLVQLGRQVQLPGQARLGARLERGAAALPAGVLVALMAVGLTGPQLAARTPASRPDNLRAVAAAIAARERPGDAILYLPWVASITSVAYPGPFRRLDDVELGVSPVVSATLRGLAVPAAELPGRLAAVPRVWTVQYAALTSRSAWAPTDRSAARLVARMRLIGRWRVGSVILSLYSQPQVRA